MRQGSEFVHPLPHALTEVWQHGEFSAADWGKKRVEFIWLFILLGALAVHSGFPLFISTRWLVKVWAEHREERRVSISAGMRRYSDAVRQCAVTISITSHICARVMGSHPDILINTGRKQGTNHQGAAMSYYRTSEHRARQSAAIQQWRPWEHSTGPKSEEGKARCRGTLQGRQAGDTAGTGATAAGASQSIEAYRVRPGRGHQGFGSSD
jgi:hypothetical protein